MVKEEADKNIMFAKRGKSCCFTGCRTHKLPNRGAFPSPEMDMIAARISTIISVCIDYGYTTFYNGGAHGIDLMAADSVLEEVALLGRDDIRLVTVVPFRGQADEWDVKWQKQYKSVKKNSEVVELQLEHTADCYDKRNRYMVERSGLVIAVWDGKPGGTRNTIKMAMEMGRDIYIIPTVAALGPLWWSGRYGFGDEAKSVLNGFDRETWPRTNELHPVWLDDRLGEG